MDGCDFINLEFDLVLRNLRYDTAIAAREMVMVFGRLTVAEQGLAFGGAKDINCALIGGGLQIAIYGRKADMLASRLGVFEDLLRGTGVVHPGQLGEYRLKLLRHSLYKVILLLPSTGSTPDAIYTRSAGSL